MKITNKILFLICGIFCNFTTMAMEKKLSEHLPLSVFPKNTSDDDKAIVKVLNNLPIVTTEDKNYVDIGSIENELKKIERGMKDRHETEILKQKAQFLEEKHCLNNQIIGLRTAFLVYENKIRNKIASLEHENKILKEAVPKCQDKIRKETFFHRHPAITWGLGVSFGMAISFGLFKLCGWFQ